MSGHTPGPWKAEIHPILGICVTAWSKPDEPRSTPYAIVRDVGSPGGKEQWANARLMAAAPELLEACRAMSACCGPAENWQGETNAALLLIEAAIAKAEGAA